MCHNTLHIREAESMEEDQREYTRLKEHVDHLRSDLQSHRSALQQLSNDIDKVERDLIQLS